MARLVLVTEQFSFVPDGLVQSLYSLCTQHSVPPPPQRGHSPGVAVDDPLHHLILAEQQPLHQAVAAGPLLLLEAAQTSTDEHLSGTVPGRDIE